ncbi:elongation factor 1-beta [Archaeoglobus sp.]
MGNVMMKIRVMPSDVDINLEEILEKVKNIQIEGLELRDHTIQPIAFGLKALVLLAVMPDAEGIGDRYIEEISKIDGVESVEIEDMELL